MSEKSQLVIIPQFNVVNSKCSDIWSSSSYFHSIKANPNEYFKSNPIAYFVYGFQNFLALTQIQDGLIRFVSFTKLFKTKKDTITCLAFSKNSEYALIFSFNLTLINTFLFPF